MRMVGVFDNPEEAVRVKIGGDRYNYRNYQTKGK